MRKKYINEIAWNKNYSFLCSVKEIYIRCENRIRNFIENVYWMSKTRTKSFALPSNLTLARSLSKWSEERTRYLRSLEPESPEKTLEEKLNKISETLDECWKIGRAITRSPTDKHNHELWSKDPDFYLDYYTKCKDHYEKVYAKDLNLKTQDLAADQREVYKHSTYTSLNPFLVDL